MDTSLRSLHAERAQLLDALRGGEAAPWPGSATPTSTGGAGQSAAGLRPPAGGGAGGRPFTGQQVLLGLGALLVAVAALVFVAVAWRLIGVGGQILLIAGITVGVGVGAHYAARRGLTQTAGSLGWLTGALFAVDAYAARELGLVSSTVEIGVYGAAAAAAGVACFAAAASVSRKVPAFSIVATAFAQVPGLALVLEAGASGPAVGLLLLAQAWANVGAFTVLQGPARRPAAVFAGAALATAALVGLGSSVEEPEANQLQGVLVCLTAAATATIWSTARPQLRFLAVLAGLLAGGEVVVGSDIAAGWQGRTFAAVAAAALLAWSYPPWRRTPDRVPIHVALAGAASGYAAALLWLADADEAGGMAVAVVALAAAATAMVVAGRRSEVYPTAALAWWAALAAALHWLDVGEGSAGVILAVGACGLFLSAWLAPGPRAEATTLVGAGVASVSAASVASGGRPLHLAAALALVGLALSAYSQRRGFGRLVVVAIGVLAASCWVLLADAGVEVVEAYTLPVAGLCLAAGLIHLRQNPGAGSWVTLGPALVALLLPTAQVAVIDPGLARSLLVIVGGSLLVVVGMHCRWQAPIVVAAPLVAEVALAQIAPVVAGVPRWLSLGVVGVTLLVAGTTYEARLSDLRRAGGWMGKLR